MSLERKNLVSEKSTRENRQECRGKRLITIGEMMHFFALLIRELKHYRIHNVSNLLPSVTEVFLKRVCTTTQANCWLFASAIQHYLQNQTNAEMVSGHLVKSDWAVDTMNRVMTGLHKLYNLSTTPILVSL